MKAAPILVVPLALAACSKPAEVRPTAAAAAPKVQVLDFSQPITVNGTEPFWSLAINGQRFRLSRPERPDLNATSPGAAIAAGRATWIAMGPGGQMTVTLYASDCADGMSDRRYPMSAEVVLTDETLHGCAVRTAELAGPGG